MYLASAPELKKPLSIAFTGIDATVNAEQRRLARLCRRERVKQFLQRMCGGTDTYIEVGIGRTPFVTLGTPLDSRGQAPRIISVAAIQYEQREIATVTVIGSNESDAASITALWLEELLALEDEVDSLTHEVVHSYEELHLLYGLGRALGGVLDVEAACALVVQMVVSPLGAAEATLILASAEGERVVAEATNPSREAEIGSPRARAVAMLQVNGETFGRLVLEGKLVGEEFTSGDLKLLEGVAAQAAPAIRNAQMYQAARLQADTDGLTGVLNHRRLQERLDEEMEEARRTGEPLSILLADLDNFKLFNDLYGHPVGDRVLRTISDCLRSSTRSTDLVGRYGGDEFLVILPRTNATGALELADRVLTTLATCEIVVQEAVLPLSLSLGIASFPADAATKHELIAHADSALYEAKGNGGGSVRLAHSRRSDWLQLQGSTYSALEGLVQSVDSKDHYTREHSEVVTEAALLLATHLRLSEESLRALRIAGLLHDVGKIGIPDSVLKKPGKLTTEEYAIMKQHVQLSEMMIKNVPYLNDVLDAVAHHHERYDGNGYPYHKSKEEIPLLGRIMAIADAYSAMCMDRPYRRQLDWQEIRGELVRGAGTQFDPELVDIFVEAMETTQREMTKGPFAYSTPRRSISIKE